jgi:FlaG/FlaF family flagellin (archaellin)
MRYEREPQKNDMNKFTGLILIIAPFIIFIVLGSALYTWTTCACSYAEYDNPFPTIEIEITDNPSGDSMKIKHLAGDPLNWSRYKLILTNHPDKSNTVSMHDLSSLPEQNAGEWINIDNEIEGFDDIDYNQDLTYQVEIYNLKENKRVYHRESVICE